MTSRDRLHWASSGTDALVVVFVTFQSHSLGLHYLGEVLTGPPRGVQKRVTIGA